MLSTLVFRSFYLIDAVYLLVLCQLLCWRGGQIEHDRVKMHNYTSNVAAIFDENISLRDSSDKGVSIRCILVNLRTKKQDESSINLLVNSSF